MTSASYFLPSSSRSSVRSTSIRALSSLTVADSKNFRSSLSPTFSSIAAGETEPPPNILLPGGIGILLVLFVPPDSTSATIFSASYLAVMMVSRPADDILKVSCTGANRSST